MADQPNPADFSVNEMRGRYDVRIRIEGYVCMRIKCRSQEDAAAQAQEFADDFFETRLDGDLNEVSDVCVTSCRPSAPRFFVMRDGIPTEVVELQPGDLPREPSEYESLMNMGFDHGDPHPTR